MDRDYRCLNLISIPHEFNMAPFVPFYRPPPVKVPRLPKCFVYISFLGKQKYLKLFHGRQINIFSYLEFVLDTQLYLPSNFPEGRYLLMVNHFSRVHYSFLENSIEHTYRGASN